MNEKQDKPSQTKLVATAAIKISLATTRVEEKSIIDFYKIDHIHCVATSFGGNYTSSIFDVIERTVNIAKKEGIIGKSHAEQGAIAGATHEAIMDIINKATGLNVGGKIGIARLNEHVCVSVFFEIGLLHLDEIAVGLGHRVI